jgi:hemoglobin-like flavoprotein
MDEDPTMLQAPDADLIVRLRADAELLRDSFAAGGADPREFAARFYSRLFELAPAARSLFPADLQAQQEKFAQTVVTIVAFAGDPGALIAGLRQLGARHVAYGAQPLHYAMVGEALLWTLDRSGQKPMTDDGRAAWRRLYGWIVAEMLAGIRGMA